MQFVFPPDFNQNELLNVRLQNLASDPGTPVAGQVYYNTSANEIRYWNSSVWIPVNTGSNITTGTLSAATGARSVPLGGNDLSFTGGGAYSFVGSGNFTVNATGFVNIGAGTAVSVSVGNGNAFRIAASGLAGSAFAPLQFIDGDAMNTFSLKPANSANYTMTLPSSVPSSDGQVITFTTAGAGSFVDPPNIIQANGLSSGSNKTHTLNGNFLLIYGNTDYDDGSQFFVGQNTISLGGGTGDFGANPYSYLNVGTHIEFSVSNGAEVRFGGQAGAAGWVLTSNGSGAGPTWQALPAATVTGVTDQANGLDVTLNGTNVEVALDFSELAALTAATVDKVNDRIPIWNQDITTHQYMTFNTLVSNLISGDANNGITTGADGGIFFNPVEQNVVADIAARNALTNVQTGETAFVIDATADGTVDTGAAKYVWNGSAWIKYAEIDAIDAAGGGFTSVVTPQATAGGLGSRTIAVHSDGDSTNQNIQETITTATLSASAGTVNNTLTVVTENNTSTAATFQRKHTQTITTTAATPFTVTHNFGTQDVIVQLRDSTSNEVVFAKVVNNAVNTVQITTTAAESLKVVILG